MLCGIKPPESRQALAGDSPPKNDQPGILTEPAPERPRTITVGATEEVPSVLTKVLTEAAAAAAEQAEKTQVAQADDTQTPRDRSEAAEPFDLSYVPTNTNLMLGIRPSQMAGEKTVAPLIDGIEKILGTIGSPGIKIADLKQVLVLGMPDERSSLPVSNRPVAVFTPEDGAGERVCEWATSFAVEMVIKGRRPVQLQQGTDARGPLVATFVTPGRKDSNPDAIAIGDPDMVRALVQAVTNKATSPDWLEEVNPVGRRHQMIFAASHATLQAVFTSNGAPVPGPTVMLAPLWEETKLLVGGASIGETGDFEILAFCRDEPGTKKVADTARALIPLGRNLFDQLDRQSAAAAARNPNAAPAQARQALGDSMTVLRNLIDSAEVTVKSDTVLLRTEGDTGSLPVIVSLLLPAVGDARSAARRQKSTNNLKMIGLALHNYHDVNGHFPAPAVLGPDGKTTHSWRVAILPYLDAAGLYKQYRQDEPWDSENNLKVLGQMPTVFRHPKEPEGSTTSCYFALTGANTALGEGGPGKKISDITDGTANTLMVVEARRDIAWTKPEDIPYDAGQPVPKLGGFNLGVFLGMFADGSVLTLSENVDEKTLRAMFTRDGREPVTR